MKKIVYLIIIFSLVSCIIPYVHKVKLTDEDLGWITHYKINDSIETSAKLSFIEKIWLI